MHRNTAHKLFMKNWALIDEDAVASKKRWISEYPFSSNDSSWRLMQTNHFSVIMHLCKSSLGKNHGNYFFKGSAAVTERKCLHEDTRLLNFRLIAAKVSSCVTLSRRTENRTWQPKREDQSLPMACCLSFVIFSSISVLSHIGTTHNCSTYIYKKQKCASAKTGKEEGHIREFWIRTHLLQRRKSDIMWFFLCSVYGPLVIHW